MIPLPVTLSHKWGCYTIKRADVEARSFEETEVEDVLQFLGMNDVQSRSAMNHAECHPGEEFTFSWKHTE